jgi:hypothetical protein
MLLPSPTWPTATEMYLAMPILPRALTLLGNLPRALTLLSNLPRALTLLGNLPNVGMHLLCARLLLVLPMRVRLVLPMCQLPAMEATRMNLPWPTCPLARSLAGSPLRPNLAFIMVTGFISSLRQKFNSDTSSTRAHPFQSAIVTVSTTFMDISLKLLLDT